ncbi:BamA/TamA family outer membrane protein [Spongiimicrobium sp. 3-5]|uniref:translocation and assembly module lipoprotein TamL n=1 Tax=Spongiimicrobium sp. 3-5 TaxID=3332596 RepID=UPI00397F0DC9
MVISSCNTLKRVEDDELLLTKNTVYADGKKIIDEDVQSLIAQKPNSTLLGYPLRLNLYNLAKKDPDSSFQDWLHRKEKRKQRLENFLSKKQVNRLGESFVVRGASEWLKKIGEPPVVIDTSQTIKSLKRLQAFYGSKGYFNNTTSFAIDTSRRKQRGALDYSISLGKPFILDSISKRIASKAIDSLYQLHTNESFIKKDEQFDLANFNNERERLTSLFRNSGIYNFQESSITYEILRDTTKLRDDQKMDVELNIKDLKGRSDNSLADTEYKVHRFKQVNIYADYDFDSDQDSLQYIDYDNYRIFYKNRLRYKPKSLTDAVFLEKDSVYRDLDRLRTYRQITNLNTFRYPNIEFVPDTTGASLISNIYLSPRRKYSLGLNTDVKHSNIETVGVAFSASLISRNIFGGAETLSLSARGSLGLLSDATIADEDFVSEIGGDVNLTFPRIWFPIVSEKVIPYYMLPQTRISMGTSFQKNIGLDKQTFNNILAYNWSPSDRVKNNIELLNIQFVRNVNPDRFFNVYQNTYSSLDEIADAFEGEAALQTFYEDPDATGNPNLIIPAGTSGFTAAILDGTVAADTEVVRDVRSIEERRIRLTEDNLIFASNYTYTKNNKSGISDNNFYQFRLKLESTGNLLSGLSRIITFDENNEGDKLIFGVPYSQYVKTEFDFIKHWDLSQSDILAFRSFFGMAVPYGNADNIPFVRSYFAGGSNDNRAWNAYSLGPGRTNNVSDFNEANLKLSLNLEYRFPIVGNIKGAFFADAGNIWNVFDDVEDPDATFNGFSSLADIALGTGFGIRYDFTYFVFRLDTGFKTYNPAEEPTKRWFRDYNFANAVFNIGINYPF